MGTCKCSDSNVALTVSSCCWACGQPVHRVEYHPWPLCERWLGVDRTWNCADCLVGWTSGTQRAAARATLSAPLSQASAYQVHAEVGSALGTLARK